jgi:omega-amidase
VKTLPKSIKISLIQCKIVAQQQVMDSNIARLIGEAAQEKPDLVILPERWRPVPSKEHFFEAIEEERGHSYDLLKDLAKKHSTYIITGGIWEKRQNNTCFITCYVFDNEGNELGRQDKLHLYSYEPSVFTPGNSLQIFTHNPSQTKFAILICFDIEFFETPRLAVEHNAEILLSPTLIREDGLYNWSIYLQARALENRVPVVACNPVGNIFGNTYLGKSKVISFKRGHSSPSILVIKESQENEQNILTQRVNLSFPNSIRKKRLDEKREKSSIQVVEI